MPTKTFSLDAYLKAIYTKTPALDAFLASPKRLVIDGVLKKDGKTKTFSLDAFLQRVGYQQLGTVIFGQKPGRMTIIHPDRISSCVRTYSSVAFFSWGPTIIGKEIELAWNAVPSGQYEAIQDLWEADATVIFNPQDGYSKIYNVEILDLKGEYCVGLADQGIRKNVVLKLLIMSQV